jgi:hypothetical protein
MPPESVTASLPQTSPALTTFVLSGIFQASTVHIPPRHSLFLPSHLYTSLFHTYANLPLSSHTRVSCTEVYMGTGEHTWGKYIESMSNIHCMVTLFHTSANILLTAHAWGACMGVYCILYNVHGEHTLHGNMTLWSINREHEYHALQGNIH